MNSTVSCESASQQLVTPDQIHAQVRDRLQRTGHLFSRTVSCQFEKGVLVLRGRVPSFYLKQLAHANVRSLAGVKEVINQIDVVGRGI